MGPVFSLCDECSKIEYLLPDMRLNENEVATTYNPKKKPVFKSEDNIYRTETKVRKRPSYLH